MPNLVPIKRVTVIAESVLEHELIERFFKLGARGYTAINCRGKGRHDVIENPYTGVSAVRIEVLVPDDVATKIMSYLQRDMFNNYAVIACLETVDVPPSDRF